MVIPIFIPWAGCVSRCVYCNEGITTGMDGGKSPEEYDETVRQYLKGAGGYERIQLGFYGGTFSNADASLQMDFLKWGNNWIKNGMVDSIRISTRPDALDDDILSEYAHFGVKSVELGVQSLFDKVLVKINRRHDSSDAFRAFEMVNFHGMELGIHMMTGLPGSDFELDRRSILRLIPFKPDTVRLHPTIVLENTSLEKTYRKGDFIPETLKQSVVNCALLKDILEKEGITVNRIGLFIPPENKSQIVAGPYHPAFGDLVKTMSNILAAVRHAENGNVVHLPKREFDSLFSHKGFFLPFVDRYLENGTITKL